MGNKSYILLIALFIGIFSFLSLYRIGFRLLRKKLSVKVNRYRVVSGISVVFCLSVTGGAVWLFLAAWYRIGVFESIDRGSLLSGLVFPAILVVLPVLYVAIYRFWRKIGVEGKEFFPKREPAISTREFETRIPKFMVQPRWRKPGIIVAANPRDFSLWNGVGLISKLNKVGNCDVMTSPLELRNPKNKIAIVIGTEHFFKYSRLYGAEDRRDNVFHPELKDFLERGNYLIATHDCHFWDEIGTFGPPLADLKVSVVSRKHAIAKGLNEFRISSEGSQLQRSGDQIKPIRINETDDAKNYQVLFQGQVILPENRGQDDAATIRVRESLDLNPFPVGWLFKFRSYYYNIFYLYLGHDDEAFHSLDFIRIITNAAAYFSSRVKRFL